MGRVKGAGDTRPDLFFPQKQPPGIVWDTEKHVHTARTDAVEAPSAIAPDEPVASWQPRGSEDGRLGRERSDSRC